DVGALGGVDVQAAGVEVVLVDPAARAGGQDEVVLVVLQPAEVDVVVDGAGAGGVDDQALLAGLDAADGDDRDGVEVGQEDALGACGPPGRGLVGVGHRREVDLLEDRGAAGGADLDGGAGAGVVDRQPGQVAIGVDHEGAAGGVLPGSVEPLPVGLGGGRGGLD